MKKIAFLILILIFGLFLSACTSLQNDYVFLKSTVAVMQEELDQITLTPAPEESGEQAQSADLGPADLSFTLTTTQDDSGLVFVGVGGDIDGQVNPTLDVEPGAVVSITLVNGQAVEHDIRIDEFDVESERITAEGEETTIVFKADQEGRVSYYCSLPGHRAAGMEGVIQIGESEQLAEAVSIVRHPADLPAPIGGRGPELVQVELVAQEVQGQLAEGASYSYFTFGGQIPGPFIRAREGDTIEITLSNELESTFIHSVDLHAVNGPGGGAVHTQTEPGETSVFSFTALNPGIYIYHCATPSVAHHIANGMYGLILVEPEGGLPPVDREFYVVQGEIYTVEDFGSSGALTFSHEKMLDENPEYFVFNGAAGALAVDENMLQAEVGETVRIYIGVAGPNFSSSFHVIGEILDRVYPFGSFTSEPLNDVQTINVNPGAAWAVEFTLEEPGDYILVDHALSRLERGLVGILHVEGEEAPDVFWEGPAQ